MQGSRRPKLVMDTLSFPPMAKGRHTAKLQMKDQEHKACLPLEWEEQQRAWIQEAGRKGAREDVFTPITKHQANLRKRSCPALLSSPASSVPASLAPGQNLEDPEQQHCSPWAPHLHLPNIWTCSGEPLISGNFFPHLICLFKENKLLLIRNTAVEMFGASQAAYVQTFCLKLYLCS